MNKNDIFDSIHTLIKSEKNLQIIEVLEELRSLNHFSFHDSILTKEEDQNTLLDIFNDFKHISKNNTISIEKIKTKITHLSNLFK